MCEDHEEMADKALLEELLMANKALVEVDNPQAWTRVADAVTRRRTDLGLGQRQAARASGVGLSTWNRIEGGASHSYRRINIVKMEKLLGWSVGSVEKILEGAEPELQEEDDSDVGEMKKMALHCLRLEQRIEYVEEQLSHMKQIMRSAGR